MGIALKGTHAHDKELRKKILAAQNASAGKGQDPTYAAKGGKGGQKGKGSSKSSESKSGKGKGKSPKLPGTVCPFFQKNGACRKGASCDMVHSLPASSAQSSGGGQGGAPEGWKAPSGVAMSNPFAAFSVEIGSVEVVKAQANQVKTLSLSKPAGDKPRFSSLDEVPKDWFHLMENGPGEDSLKGVRPQG